MAEPVQLNRAALARRYGVHRSSITRALQKAAKAHARDPSRTAAPPKPLNPGEPNELFDPDVFDAFWPPPARRGRPPNPTTKDN